MFPQIQKNTRLFKPSAFEKSMERGREPIGRKMAHRLANALGTSYKN